MDIKKAKDIIDKMYQDKMNTRIKQKKEGVEIDLSKNVTFTELEEASIILLRNYLALKRKNEESNYILEENEALKRAFDRQTGDIGNYLVELQQKDKQIDLMAEFIKKNISEKKIINEICIKGKCNNEECHEDDLKECVKQYFEKQAKKKGE